MNNLIVSIYCPHCHQHTSLTLASAEVRTALGNYTTGVAWEAGINSVWWIGICNYCKTPVLAHNNGDIIHPSPLPSPTDERIPKQIRLDLEEAKRCYSSAAWRATCVMARRAIQSCAIDKGAKKIYAARANN